MTDPLPLFLNFLLFSPHSPFCSHTTISYTLINPDSFLAKETAGARISSTSQHGWQLCITHASAKVAAPQKCLLRPSNLTYTLALSGTSACLIVILVLITNREIVFFDFFIIAHLSPVEWKCVSAGILDIPYCCILHA